MTLRVLQNILGLFFNQQGWLSGSYCCSWSSVLQYLYPQHEVLRNFIEHKQLSRERLEIFHLRLTRRVYLLLARHQVAPRLKATHRQRSETIACSCALRPHARALRLASWAVTFVRLRRGTTYFRSAHVSVVAHFKCHDNTRRIDGFEFW